MSGALDPVPLLPLQDSWGVPLVKDDEGCIQFDYATNLVGENLLHDREKWFLEMGGAKWAAVATHGIT